MSELKKVKKSNRVNVRLKRVVNELTKEGNHYNIGCTLLEEFIIHGMKDFEKEIENRDETKNHFISSRCYEQTFEIVKKHLSV